MNFDIDTKNGGSFNDLGWDFFADFALGRFSQIS